MINKLVKQPRWEHLILGIIIILLVMLGVAGSVVSSQARKPVHVSDRFVHALLSQDFEAAYDLTAEPYRQTTTDEKFVTVATEFVSTLKTDPRVTSHIIERTPAGNLVATVEYSIPGSARRLTVKLTQENEAWRVLNINNTL